ncbi:uncharacterized protein EI90DRAFT_3031770 [Cantharellus anzutake]|uniref:uncharacterized protein n=1 Tax=Cantharellus anzutake TaxID=1750568 RepID=UPI00190423AE|nr:uncharacterized protein EI90DRAFT_3031770 [Cantharellus anzutake]KAF8341989.1 hypothetical protein EI90DRAFT_3031770 [Cantharellus anzutake]
MHPEIGQLMLRNCSMGTFQYMAALNVTRQALPSTSSPNFISRAEAMDALVLGLEAKLAEGRLGGGQAVLEKMRSKGKKLRPMGTAFVTSRSRCSILELNPLAAHEENTGQNVPEQASSLELGAGNYGYC